MIDINEEVNTRYLEICNELLSTYGEQKIEVINGKNYVKSNPYYTAFTKATSALTQNLTKFGWDLNNYTCEMLLLLEYFKTAQYNVLEYLSKVFKKNNNQHSYEFLFNDLNAMLKRNLGCDKVRRSLELAFGIWLVGSNRISINRIDKHHGGINLW